MNVFKPQAERQVRATPKPQAERQVRAAIKPTEGKPMRRMICNIAITFLSLSGAGAMLFALVLTVDAQLWGYASISFVGLVCFLALLVMSLADLAESELGHG